MPSAEAHHDHMRQREESETGCPPHCCCCNKTCCDCGEEKPVPELLLTDDQQDFIGQARRILAEGLEDYAPATSESLNDPDTSLSSLELQAVVGLACLLEACFVGSN